MAKDTDKCEVRIAEHLGSRIETLEALWKSYCAGEESHPEYGNFCEYGLSFDYVAPGTFGEDQRQGYFRYQLSWGGPSDEFRFYCGPEFEPYKIEYWFMDWFDGASRTLRGDREKLLMEIFNFFKECGSVEHQYQEATAA
jgi:hypothetical protein